MGERSALRVIVSSIIAVGILVAVWAIAAGNMRSIYFSQFQAVIEALKRLTANGELQPHIEATLDAFFSAIVPALIIGLVVGTILGFVRFLRLMFGSLVSMLAWSPLVAISPVTILWFGFGGKSAVAVGLVAAVFPVADRIMTGFATAFDRPKTAAAVPPPAATAAPAAADTPAPAADAAVAVAAAPAIPAAAATPPANVGATIFAGARVGVASCWTGVIVAELVGAPKGLGYFAMHATMSLNVTDALAALLVVFIPCLAVVTIIRIIEAAVVKS